LLRGRVRHPGALQRGQFLADVADLGRVGHALGLDLQDRDLVQQFAVGDGHQQFVVHAPDSTRSPGPPVPGPRSQGYPRRTRMAVTLSDPPLSSAADTSSSTASWALPSWRARISAICASGTSSVSPSLHSSNCMPTPKSPDIVSTFRSCGWVTPSACVTTLRCG